MLPLLEKLIAIKKPATGLPKSLLDKYREVGAALAFRVEPIEKGLLFVGKTATVALKVEFGNRWEFFNTITALRETDADIKVLVTSSNSKAMQMETIYTVLKKKLEEKNRWVLIDIEGKKKPMFLNFREKSAPARGRPKAAPKPQPKAPPKTSRSSQQEPELKKTKNYGMQPANAKPRRKKIYGKRRKNKN